MGNINIGGRLHSTATGNVVAGANEILDDTKGAKQSAINAAVDTALDNRYTKSETYSRTQLDNMITTPNQEYVTVEDYASLPESGEADTIYRVANWDGSLATPAADITKYSEYAWDGTGYVFLCVKSQIGEVFDISAANSGATYADLAAALDGGDNVPAGIRRGGMSVKYIQNSDNKYVQYRLMSDSFNTTPANWQSVDDVPTVGSNNLVKSGGVYKGIYDAIAGSVMGSKQVEKISTENGYVDSNSGNFSPHGEGSHQVTFYSLRGTSVNDTIYLKVNGNVVNEAKYYAFYYTDKQTGQLINTSIDGKHDYVNGITYINVPEGADQIGVITKFPGSTGSESDYSFDVRRESNDVDVKYGDSIPPKEVRDGYVDTRTGNFSPHGEGSHQVTFYSVLENRFYSIVADVSFTAKNYAFYYGYEDETLSTAIGGCHYFVNGTRLLNVPKGANVIGIISKYPDGDSENDKIELVESQKVDFIENTFHNRKPKAIEQIKNGYVNSENGNLYSYGSGTHQVALYSIVNVRWGSTLVVKVSDDVTFDAKYCSFYGISYGSSTLLSLTGKIDYVNGLNYIKIPDGAKYFGIITKFPTGDGDESDFSVEYDNGGITKEMSEYYDWTGKYWAVVGDSLTENNARCVKHYFDYISELTNVNILNWGSSGQGYASGEWFKNAISQASGYDFLTVFGSGNDIRYTIIPTLSWASSWEQALGTITDTGNSTICGCMNDAFDTFYVKTPHKKIGVMTPTPWKNGTYIEELTDAETYRRMEMYSDKLVEICRKRGIPCLDLFHCSGLQPTIESFRVEYYKEENLQDEGVHPNSKGQKWISSIIFDFVKTFLI